MRTWLLVSVAVTLAGLSACSKPNDKEAAEATPVPAVDGTAAPMTASATSPFIPVEMEMKEKMGAVTGPTVDHAWAMKMIPHHQGAIDLSKTLLAQSPNGPMQAMAQKTIDDQTKDVGELKKWVHGHPAPAGAGVNPFADAEQKMHEHMMAASGPDADQTWARKMIEHHQGAIDMATRVLQVAKDAEIRRIAQKTIDMQKQDIEKLRGMLSS